MASSSTSGPFSLEVGTSKVPELNPTGMTNQSCELHSPPYEWKLNSTRVHLNRTGRGWMHCLLICLSLAGSNPGRAQGASRDTSLKWLHVNQENAGVRASVKEITFEVKTCPSWSWALVYPGEGSQTRTVLPVVHLPSPPASQELARQLRDLRWEGLLDQSHHHLLKGRSIGKQTKIVHTVLVKLY